MSITPNCYTLRCYPVKQIVDEIRLATDTRKLEKYEDYECLIKKIDSTLFEGPQEFNSFELSEIIFYVLNNKYLDGYNTPRSQISKIKGWKYHNCISRHGYKIIQYSDKGLQFLIITEKGIYNLTGLGYYNTSSGTVRTITNFINHYIRNSLC
jgi:hypothetical protein